MKVSFNLGAEITLLHIGLANGVNNSRQALLAEQEILVNVFGISSDSISFVDGSGGQDSAATSESVMKVLQVTANRPSAAEFRNALPRLGVDGTLGIVTSYQSDPSLVGATANVLGKTGTFIEGTDEGLIRVRCRAMAGYITTRSGREISYVLNINNAGDFETFGETAEVNQDLGVIAAILWRDL